jgi:hypothetical protein
LVDGVWCTAECLAAVNMQLQLSIGMGTPGPVLARLGAPNEKAALPSHNPRCWAPRSFIYPAHL